MYRLQHVKVLPGRDTRPTNLYAVEWGLICGAIEKAGDQGLISGLFGA